MFRKHQQEFSNVVDGIISGSGIKKIYCRVTPGGGKSALPIISARLITAGLADALAWIVPRSSLQAQGEGNFQASFFRRILNHRYSIRSNTNELDPCRGLDGWISTYQAIGVDNQSVTAVEFSRKRYILILDEYHHVAEGSIWHRSLAPLVKSAAFLVLMTGTLERGDGKPIAFTPYDVLGQPDLRSDADTAVIEYSRSDALAEQAIIPLRFTFSDASVHWEDESKNKFKYSSITRVEKKHAGSAIYTAIDTEFAQQLLNEGTAHWQKHKISKNPRSRLLVVTATYKHAIKTIDWYQAKGFRSEIATSHDDKKAAAAIKGFKEGRFDVLVSIAMAYEGFDCKSVTHIICLTNIRSTPWIEQMLARAVRVDDQAGSYSDQYGYVFAPDDILFREIVEKIRAEQLPYLKKRGKKKQLKLFKDEDKKNRESENPYGIKPIGSRMTMKREFGLGALNVSRMETPPKIEIVPETPKEKEGRILKSIEKHVRLFSYQNHYRDGRINAEIKSRFGKSRRQMTLEELEYCLEYVEQTYPLIASMPQPRCVSRRRGRYPRVSNQAQPWP